MPTHTPAYTRHPSGQAVVRFRVAPGKYRSVYLGPFDSPESHALYHRLVAEWLATGAVPGGRPEPRGVTVGELVFAYLPHADDTMSHVKRSQVRRALGVLSGLYESLPAADFTGRCLRAVRERMVAEGWGRDYVNAQADRVRRCFRWGVSERLVPQATLDSLLAVEGLRKGRTAAPEPRKVPPVPEADALAVCAHVSPQIAGLIRLQLHTGCRPGEAVQLRPRDLDRAADVWLYRPRKWKTEGHGERVIFLGPRAQAALAPFLDRPPECPCFSPRESLLWWRGRNAVVREDRLGIVPGEQFAESSYARAVRAGCARAGVPHWSPNQLRHTAASLLEREFGWETARIILGHATVNTTKIYVAADHERATKAMRQVG